MSGLQTYVLRCDGEGCCALFQVVRMKRLTDIRATAAGEGWRHALIDRGQGPASSYDFCPNCTVPGAAVKQRPHVLLSPQHANYALLILRDAVRCQRVAHPETAATVADALERGLVSP